MAKRVDVKSPMLFTSAECERVSSEWITGGLRGFADTNLILEKTTGKWLKPSLSI